MANVKKVTLANGETRWRMRLYVGRDPDTGKQEIITGTLDADAEVTRLKAMRQKGGVVTPSKEPLGKYLDKWLRTVKEGNLRARTYSDRRGVLERYVQDPPAGAPRIGLIPLNQLAPQAIQDLYHHLRERRGFPPVRSGPFTRWCARGWTTRPVPARWGGTWRTWWCSRSGTGGK